MHIPFLHTNNLVQSTLLGTLGTKGSTCLSSFLSTSQTLLPPHSVHPKWIYLIKNWRVFSRNVANCTFDVYQFLVSWVTRYITSYIQPHAFQALKQMNYLSHKPSTPASFETIKSLLWSMPRALFRPLVHHHKCVVKPHQPGQLSWSLLIKPHTNCYSNFKRCQNYVNKTAESISCKVS